jgi:hypothetical protein
MTVRREIEERTGRNISIGAVYTTLERLQAKGYAPRAVILDLPVYIAKALKVNSKAWQLNERKHAKGAFANRSHCWWREKSSA